MSAVLVASHEPNSPEWHETRATGIGASDVAAIVGLSPWQSAFHLWHVRKGNLPAEPDKPQFKWGHLLEPVIAAEFEERHPEYWVHPAGTYAPDDRRWQLANVDRLLYPIEGVNINTRPTSLLEIKTSRFGDGYGPTQTDQIPLHVRCQVQYQLDVFDLPYAHVAVLVGGNDYREYVIDADPDDQLALRDAAAAFWWSLQTDDEPPLDASESTYQAVRSLHPEISGEDTTIDPALYAAYLLSEGKAQEWERTHRETRSRVLAAMGDARRGLVNGTPVFRRQPNRNGVSLYHIGESA